MVFACADVEVACCKDGDVCSLHLGDCSLFCASIFAFSSDVSGLCDHAFRKLVIRIDLLSQQSSGSPLLSRLAAERQLRLAAG